LFKGAFAVFHGGIKLQGFKLNLTKPCRKTPLKPPFNHSFSISWELFKPDYVEDYSYVIGVRAGAWRFFAQERPKGGKIGRALEIFL
jgi:hypothetical protein